MNRVLLILGILSLSGCVTIFSRVKQPVTVKTELNGGEIYQVDQKIGTTMAVARVPKRDGVTQFTVKKEGYMDRNHAICTMKKNPLRFANLIMLPTIFGYIYVESVEGLTPKKFQYESKVSMKENIKTPTPKTDKQKYVFLNKTSMNIAKDDTVEVVYNYYKNYLKNKNTSIFKNEKNKLKFENTIFSDDLKYLLHKYGFRDTTKTIFPSYTNTVYVNADIKDIKFTTIYPYRATGNNICKVNIMVEYELLDYYEQPLKKFNIKAESDFFAYNINYLAKNKDNDTNQNGHLRSLKNAMEYSLIKLMADKDFLAISELGNEKAATMETITIAKPATTSKRLNDLIKSAVTIKNGDSHGSGFIISPDGYIISNLHVVANANDKLVVVMSDGEKVPAKVIRTTVKSDLALIKIEKTGLPVMTVKDTEFEAEIGANVSTIGTPKSVELGQSVSKGIISGVRKANNINYLQTDMSINGGNSGGAMIAEDGNVIGVINAKMFGVGVEGIGFGIPSHLIFKDLAVKYK